MSEFKSISKSKVLIKCDFCGKEFERYKSRMRDTFNFCSMKCAMDFSNKEKNPERYKEFRDISIFSKIVSESNKKLNPERMTPEVREKLHNSQTGKGHKNTYVKYYGRHLHRIIAEEILGRPLKKGEVVHHIDGNKKNNNPSNLMIFKSQSEHAKWHAEHDKKKEVI